jgi:hypothetical protein
MASQKHHGVGKLVAVDDPCLQPSRHKRNVVFLGWTAQVLIKQLAPCALEIIYKGRFCSLDPCKYAICVSCHCSNIVVSLYPWVSHQWIQPAVDWKYYPPNVSILNMCRCFSCHYSLNSAVWQLFTLHSVSQVN